MPEALKVIQKRSAQKSGRTIGFAVGRASRSPSGCGLQSTAMYGVSVTGRGDPMQYLPIDSYAEPERMDSYAKPMDAVAAGCCCCRLLLGIRCCRLLAAAAAGCCCCCWLLAGAAAAAAAGCCCCCWLLLMLQAAAAAPVSLETTCIVVFSEGPKR